jgi:hypothetical protein
MSETVTWISCDDTFPVAIEEDDPDELTPDWPWPDTWIVNRPG